MAKAPPQLATKEVKDHGSDNRSARPFTDRTSRITSTRYANPVRCLAPTRRTSHWHEATTVGSSTRRSRNPPTPGTIRTTPHAGAHQSLRRRLAGCVAEGPQPVAGPAAVCGSPGADRHHPLVPRPHAGLSVACGRGKAERHREVCQFLASDRAVGVATIGIVEVSSRLRPLVSGAHIRHTMNPTKVRRAPISMVVPVPSTERLMGSR